MTLIAAEWSPAESKPPLPGMKFLRMKRGDPVENTVAFFADGYLCSQSIMKAYAQRFGIDPALAAAVAVPFGAGMGRMGWTCGAVTGALMVIGLRYGQGAENDKAKQERVFEIAKEFLSRFQAQTGSVECKTLLGRDLSTPEGLKSAREEGLFQKLCSRYVEDAAKIVGEIIDRPSAEGAE